MKPTQKGSSSLAALLLVIANVLIPIAILTFAAGFFPYKPVLPGLAQYEELEYGDPPDAPFDRVVFMVVDALRSDFVFEEGMGFEYTQGLIQEGAAMPFTAHATSPTITMPRIKAITTGGIPSFLDVILNFDETDTSSSLASQDTWLAQMKAKDSGKVIMYGDDTWLKLFPNAFDRAEGTSSFFVSDFTEVDNNVTRHIPDELKRDDWNTMILHFLGLDHIGHKAGPRSPNMLPKQREMDSIVRDIYETMETEEHLKSTLLVLCGDHGMNDAGNHGASSPGETSPALVFMSPKLQSISTHRESPLPHHEEFQYYTTVEQSDVAPTLAGLLGFPVPQNNLGAFITEFLPLWPRKDDQIQILRRNARQILNIVKAAFPSAKFESPDESCDTAGNSESQAESLACHWHDTVSGEVKMAADVDIDPEWVEGLAKWLHDAQGLMTSMASNYHMPRLFLGMSLTFTAIITSGLAFHLSRSRQPLSSATPFALVATGYGIMMFASSYVEEEHHFWYWATTAWLFYLGITGIRNHPPTPTRSLLTDILALVTALAAIRLFRAWNQTGQKFAGEPDIVKLYLTPYPSILWALVALTYLHSLGQMTLHLGRLINSHFLAFIWSSGVILAASTFKLTFTHEDAPELVVGIAGTVFDMLLAHGRMTLVGRAQLVFLSLALVFVFAMHAVLSTAAPRRRRSAVASLLDVYTVVAITQSRTANIPLFLLMHVLHYYIKTLGLGTGLRRDSRRGLGRREWGLSVLLMQHASFFAFGGSNAISSVDLSSAYNGVGRFDVVAVGILTFVGNWAGGVWWGLQGVRGCLERGWEGDELVEGRARVGYGDKVVDGAVDGGVTVGGSGEVKVSKTKNEEEQGEQKGKQTMLWTGHIAMLTVFTACALGAVMAACTILRTHLFIWTVFSPKYLYSMAWSLGQHLVVNVVLGGGLYWVGSA